MMILGKKSKMSLNQFLNYEHLFKQENAHMQEGRRPISKRWSALNNINNIVQIDENTIATSNTVSYEVRFWNINSKHLLFVLTQNHGWVRRISYCKTNAKLFLLLSPNVMLIFKKNQTKMQFTLQSQISLNSRCEILISNNIIYYAGENSEVGALNLNTRKRISQTFLNKPVISIEKWRNFIIVGTEVDISFCNKVNLQSEKIIQKAHKSSIHILKILKDTQFNEEVLFSASYDRSCKLWNPETLELIQVLDFSADHIQIINQSQLLVHPFQYDKTSHCIILFDVNNASNAHLLPFSDIRCISAFHYIQDQRIFILGFKQNSFEVYQALSRKQSNKRRLQSILKQEIKVNKQS